jgi:hypothetical protein
LEVVAGVLELVLLLEQEGVVELELLQVQVVGSVLPLPEVDH